MTIEQQLQDFAQNPVAGGVRWEISDDDAFGRVIYLIGEVNDNTNIVISLFNKKIRVWIDCSWTQLKATTIREACEEAVQLVKVRAKEIYEALGGEWISVEDRLPETKGEYHWVPVAIVNNEGEVYGCFYDKNEGFHTDEGLPYDAVMWHPLPSPPKTEN